MAFLKSKQLAPFVVPSLADADPTYADLVAKREELLTRQSALRGQRRTLEDAISKMPEPAVPASVAALLGDAPDSKAGKRQELARVIAEGKDIAAALDVLGRRISEARDKASVAVCAAVEEEYRKRVGDIAEALKNVALAREHFHQLVDQLEAEDVAWTRLGPISLNFLGDRRDGHLQRFLKENGHAE